MIKKNLIIFSSIWEVYSLDLNQATHYACGHVPYQMEHRPFHRSCPAQPSPAHGPGHFLYWSWSGQVTSALALYKLLEVI